MIQGITDRKTQAPRRAVLQGDTSGLRDGSFLIYGMGLEGRHGRILWRFYEMGITEPHPAPDMQSTCSFTAAGFSVTGGITHNHS